MLSIKLHILYYFINFWKIILMNFDKFYNERKTFEKLENYTNLVFLPSRMVYMEQYYYITTITIFTKALE